MFKFLVIAGSIEIMLSLIDTEDFGVGIHVYRGYEIDSEHGWTHVNAYNLMLFFFSLRVKHITLTDNPQK